MSKVNQLGQYKGISVNVQKQEVTQEEYEQQLSSLLAQSAILEDKEGNVELGDVTIIDFEGYKDGVAFEGGSAKGHQLEIGSGQFIPGFEEQMIGMAKGETKDLNLTFPENYGVADLAGADVIFKVTVHNIQKKKIAQLNEEFVAQFQIPNVKTVEEFEEALKANIQAQHDQTFRTNVENAVFDLLLKNSDVDVEEEDINKAMEEHIQHINMELSSQGMQLDQYLQMMGMSQEALREQLLPSAKQQAIFEAIIDEVAVVENIITTDEEVDQQIEAIAAQNQMTKEQVIERVSAADLRRDFTRVKASQLIIGSAIVNK